MGVRSGIFYTLSDLGYFFSGIFTHLRRRLGHGVIKGVISFGRHTRGFVFYFQNEQGSGLGLFGTCISGHLRGLWFFLRIR